MRFPGIWIMVFSGLALFGSSSAFSAKTPATKTKALIYKGEGSCVEGCSESAAKMAELAGFQPVFVSPAEFDPKVFADAAVWIQPGGESLIVAAKMKAELKSAIRGFIRSGGGYVGFCAGAYFTDHLVHGKPSLGLAVLPGVAMDYAKAPSKEAMLELIWNGKKRVIYWEEGPYLVLKSASGNFKPFAYYPTGEVASVQGRYFRGRVSITGVHPEAPQWWRDDIHAQDPDGLDYDLAIEMIRWAAGVPAKNPVKVTGTAAKAQSMPHKGASRHLTPASSVSNHIL
jgi:hypothetical protein